LSSEGLDLNPTDLRTPPELSMILAGASERETLVLFGVPI